MGDVSDEGVEERRERRHIDLLGAGTNDTIFFTVCKVLGFLCPETQVLAASLVTPEGRTLQEHTGIPVESFDVA